MNNYPSYTGIIISQCKDPVMNQLGFHGMSGFCSRRSSEGRTTYTFLDDKEITYFFLMRQLPSFSLKASAFDSMQQELKARFFLAELMWKNIFLKLLTTSWRFFVILLSPIVVGGHSNQPLKRSHFHSPSQKVTAWVTWLSWFLWKTFSKSQPNHPPESVSCATSLAGSKNDIPYGWWFWNPVEAGSLSHDLQGFSKASKRRWWWPDFGSPSKVPPQWPNKFRLVLQRIARWRLLVYQTLPWGRAKKGGEKHRWREVSSRGDFCFSAETNCVFFFPVFKLLALFSNAC